MEHQRGIRAARQHEPHIHAAGDSRFQRGKQLRIRHEVSIRQPDFSLGAVDRRDQGDVNLAEWILGRAADRTHDLVTLGR